MITPATFLLTGGGRLDPAWYEPHDLTTLLATWISDETAPGEDEKLTIARVYRRAFTTAADLIMSSPASQRDRDKSSAYSAEQLAYWRAQAAAYQDEIDDLLGVTSGPVLAGWEGTRRCGT